MYTVVTLTFALQSFSFPGTIAKVKIKWSAGL